MHGYDVTTELNVSHGILPHCSYASTSTLALETTRNKRRPDSAFQTPLPSKVAGSKLIN